MKASLTKPQDRALIERQSKAIKAADLSRRLAAFAGEPVGPWHEASLLLQEYAELLAERV